MMRSRRRSGRGTRRISTIWSILRCAFCMTAARRPRWRKRCPRSTPRSRWTNIRTRTPCRTRSSARSRKTRAICSWSATSSRASTASALRTRRSSSRNTARSPMRRRQRRVRRAASSSAAISARAGRCSRRATISSARSWARRWAIWSIPTGRRCTSAQDIIHRLGTNATRPRCCSRTRQAATRMRPKRPSSRRGSWRSA